MAVTYSNYDGTLANSATSLFASSLAQTYLITRATIENNDNIRHAVSVYRVQPGGTVGTSNLIVNPNNRPGLIEAGETLPLPLSGHNLVGGQSIWAMVDASANVNISISYTIIDN